MFRGSHVARRFVKELQSARRGTSRHCFAAGVGQHRLPHVGHTSCRLFSFIADDKYERYRHLTPDVVKEIELENQRTRRCIDQALKDQIEQEILEAAAEPESVPELGPTGQYLYHSVDDSQGNRTYFRQHVDSGDEQLVFSVSFRELQMHAMSLSVNETYVACLVSSVGSPSRTQVMIRNLETGREMVLPTTQDMTVANIEWGPMQPDGSDSLFFTSSNELGRPDTVYTCRVQPDGAIGPLIFLYRNDNEAVMVDVQRTKGCKYMAIHAHTKTSSEIYLVQDISDAPLVVRPRQEGVQYHVDVGEEDDIFILANAVDPKHESNLSEELSLFETTLSALPLGSSFGKPLSGANDDHFIWDMDIFKSFIALYEGSSLDGRQRIRIKQRTDSNIDHVLPLPNDCGDCAFLSTSGNMFYSSSELRFRLESPCSPGRTYAYDTSTRKLQAVSSVSTQSPYVQKRVFVTSADGTKVPLSLIYSSEEPWGALEKDGRRPTVLVGYGAYGEPVVHGFDPTIVPLLNRGFVLAYAHTRGGGELGRAWYRGGRLYEKERVVDDFVACAEAIVGALGISKRHSLTAKSFSAGGVAVAGAVNREPLLFGSVVLTNAFLDVTNAMSNTHLALTEHEHDEWGNPADKEALCSIASYCPSLNVKPQEYPNMLLIGTLDDANVPFWHPLAFALMVRSAIMQSKECSSEDNKTVSHAMPLLDKQSKHRILLHLEPSGGHHLHGTRLTVSALEAAFIIQSVFDWADK